MAKKEKKAEKVQLSSWEKKVAKKQEYLQSKLDKVYK